MGEKITRSNFRCYFREITRLTGKKLRDAIKSKSVEVKLSLIIPSRAVGFKEQKYHVMLVWDIYIYQVNQKVDHIHERLILYGL